MSIEGHKGPRDLDIEPELGNDEIIIENPFDPNKIKVSPKPYSIGQIVQDLGYGIINLDTEFQRLPNLWDDRKKSRFIESLILNLPIPQFYFSEHDDNTWEVIDGLQRISTIKDFVADNNLVLKDLEFLTEFNAKKFEDLPTPLKTRINRFSINLYVIEKGTPPEVKYNIFRRVNTGGLELTPQEIRHAINQGIPAELVADLVRGVDTIDKDGNIKTRRNRDKSIVELKATSEGKSFIHATGNRINPIRMEDRDFANRFIAFYLIGYEDYKPDMDTFLNTGMKKIKELGSEGIDKLKFDFRESMELAHKIFGNDAYRKRFSPDHRRKPINKALFEVLSVSFAKLSEAERTILLQRTVTLKEKLMNLHNKKDGKFVRAITSGTAQKDMVIQRYNDIAEIIKETLQNDQQL